MALTTSSWSSSTSDPDTRRRPANRGGARNRADGLDRRDALARWRHSLGDGVPGGSCSGPPRRLRAAAVLPLRVQRDSGLSGWFTATNPRRRKSLMGRPAPDGDRPPRTAGWHRADRRAATSAMVRMAATDRRPLNGQARPLPAIRSRKATGSIDWMLPVELGVRCQRLPRTSGPASTPAPPREVPMSSHGVVQV